MTCLSDAQIASEHPCTLLPSTRHPHTHAHTHTFLILEMGTLFWQILWHFKTDKYPLHADWPGVRRWKTGQDFSQALFSPHNYFCTNKLNTINVFVVTRFESVCFNPLLYDQVPAISSHFTFHLTSLIQTHSFDSYWTIKTVFSDTMWVTVLFPMVPVWLTCCRTPDSQCQTVSFICLESEV